MTHATSSTAAGVNDSKIGGSRELRGAGRRRFAKHQTAVRHTCKCCYYGPGNAALATRAHRGGSRAPARQGIRSGGPHISAYTSPMDLQVRLANMPTDSDVRGPYGSSQAAAHPHRPDPHPQPGLLLAGTADPGTELDVAPAQHRQFTTSTMDTWTFYLPSNTDSLEGHLAELARFLLEKSLIICTGLRATVDTSDKRPHKAGASEDPASLVSSAMDMGLGPDSLTAFIDAVVMDSARARTMEAMGLGTGSGLGMGEDGTEAVIDAVLEEVEARQDDEGDEDGLGAVPVGLDRARLQSLAAEATRTPRVKGIEGPAEAQPELQPSSQIAETSSVQASGQGTGEAQAADNTPVAAAGASTPAPSSLQAAAPVAATDSAAGQASTTTTTPRLVLELLPGPGVYPFTYRGHAMELVLVQQEKVHTVMQGLRLARRMDACLRVTGCSQGRAARVVASLMAEAHTWAESLLVDTVKSVRLHTNKDGYWSLSYKPKRSLDTVYLPSSIKDRARSEVSRFLRERPDYEKFGVPYRRCFLLAGPPGTGKTSLIHALASTFDLPLYILSVTPKTDDHALMSQLQAAGDKRSVSMVVLEDVDALFTRDRASANAGGSLSFSGLLNALDGLGSPSGLLLALTTNYIDRLDPALIRPGRVDTILRFDHMGREQVEQTWRTLMPHALDQLPSFMRRLSSSSACTKLSPATLQKWLFDHRHEHGRAILDRFNELEELASYFKARHAAADGAYESYTL